MARKSAAGAGTIRKKTVMRKGKEYTYWEARYTEGVDPGTGKQIQRSITGKTQKEVSQKLKAATTAIDSGTYIAPSKMKLSEWLDIWTKDYLGGVKPKTLESYQCQIKNHIKPSLGAIRLEALNTHTIQAFYNTLSKPNGDKPGLSPKSVKIIHGVLHKALNQAIAVGYLRFNPADACKLPRVVRKELKPMDDDAIGKFLKAIRCHKYESLFLVTLFTGMRQGEVLGLMWNCIDFERGTILINKQLQKVIGEKDVYNLMSTKSGKGRSITPACYVMDLLRAQKARQAEAQLLAGELWHQSDLVFTNELGEHLRPHTVYHNFKAVVASIGMPELRFHDLRHSYAVAAIRSGDDIKTVQGNLGHATASFTLDVYGHVTEQMKKESAARMDSFIQGVSNR